MNEPEEKDIFMEMAKHPEQYHKSKYDFQLYTLTQLEPILGVTHRTLLQYVKDKKLKAVKIGGRWTVSSDNLKKFINGETE